MNKRTSDSCSSGERAHTSCTSAELKELKERQKAKIKLALYLAGVVRSYSSLVLK
jgi:hypothetical protein